MAYTDPSGRLISELFQKLPSKMVRLSQSRYVQMYVQLPWDNFEYSFFFLFLKHYPDYYAIIKDPIDMRTIAQRIQVSASQF